MTELHGIYVKHHNQPLTLAEGILALTLCAYVSGDDVELTRDDFLFSIATRILDDLKAKGYPLD